MSNCPMQGVSSSKTTWRIEGELLFCDVDKLGQSASYVRLKTSLYHTQSVRYSESSCSPTQSRCADMNYDVDFDRMGCSVWTI